VEGEKKIVSYSAARLEEMPARGEDRTDIARVMAKTEEELASDPDWADIPADWPEEATALMPANKQLLSLRRIPTSCSGSATRDRAIRPG
jgi:hypothetical protein